MHIKFGKPPVQFIKGCDVLYHWVFLLCFTSSVSLYISEMEHFWWFLPAAYIYYSKDRALTVAVTIEIYWLHPEFVSSRSSLARKHWRLGEDPTAPGDARAAAAGAKCEGAGATADAHKRFPCPFAGSLATQFCRRACLRLSAWVSCGAWGWTRRPTSSAALRASTWLPGTELAGGGDASTAIFHSMWVWG